MEPLDGNAIAGALHEALGREMTTSFGVCATCGNSNQVGTLVVYLGGPGAVARCPICGSVQMVLVQKNGLISVDSQGLEQPFSTAGGIGR